MKAQEKQNFKGKIRTTFLFFAFCYLPNIIFSQEIKQPNYQVVNIKLEAFKSKSDSIALNSKANFTVSNQDYNSIYNNHLGVFCKLENKVLKTSHIPLRMRLGSKDYVDQLEQKVPLYKIPK
ncbi:MAG: hypothetical protein HKN51_04825 [Saprospiraceae bacterium]|nr:hypothetical protein [Saprospiraceae bacterium]